MYYSNHLRPGRRAFYRCMLTLGSFVVIFIHALPTYAQLSGTYTLGSAGDYVSFNAAIAALETEGISGPVTFSVQPGTYEEQVEINNIPGSSCEVPVVFEGDATTQTAVVLQAPDTASTSSIIQINNVDGLGFRNMSILSQSRSAVIDVAPGADCFMLENNLLNYSVRARSMDDTRSHYHQYRNNTFLSGGINKENTAPWNPDSPVFDDGLVIEGNKVSSIKINGQQGFTISSNQLYNADITVTNSWYGQEISKNKINIDIEEYDGAAINVNSSAASKISENQIELSDGGTGMRISTGKSVGDEVLIANNLILVSGYDARGIFYDPLLALVGLEVSSNYSNQVKIYHNTVWVSGYSETSTVPNYTFNVSGDNNSFFIKNNTFGNSSNGTNLIINNPSAIAEMDYNNLYDAYARLFARWGSQTISSLAEWRSVTGFGEHSVNVNPGSSTNPNAALQGAGIYLSEVPQDIYGQNRNDPPTIGAIEEAFASPTLSGTYTIGGADGDYASFTEAIAALSRYSVEDSVVFQVRPGVYQEQINFVDFRGKKVIFEGESDDSTEVVITFPIGDAIAVQEASGITFRYLTIHGISLINSGGSLFEHNVIREGVNVYPIERRIGSGIGNLVFRNNFFDGQGLSIDGGTPQDPGGAVEIRSNVFEVEGTAISLSGLQGVKISHNKIYARKGGTGKAVGIGAGSIFNVEEISHNTVVAYGTEALGVDLTAISKDFPEEFAHNKILLPDGGTGVDFGVGSSGNTKIFNNMVSVKGGQGSRGIVVSEGKLNFYYNSVYIYGDEDRSSAAFYVIEEFDFDVTLVNNVLANLAGGYVFNVRYDTESGTWLDSSDYNNLYTNGEVFANWEQAGNTAASLSEWQNITGMDSRSLSVNPQFISPENLTPGNEALAGAGVAIPEVEEDFFGDERPDPPTIGAVELEGEGGNQIPTADAGPDRTVTLPQESIILRGVAFDSDGVFRAFQWEKVSGPSVTLERANTANVIVKDLVADEYVFRFSATDNDGATASDELTLTVKGGTTGNQPPTADAGQDQTLTLPNNSIILRGTGNDPDGNFRAFRWEKLSGPSATLNQQNTANLKLSDLVAGEYVFRFSATDNDGATASDETTLRVIGTSEATPLADNTRVTAYPNTFRDDVNVKIESAQPESYRMQVYDALGRIYYQDQVNAEPLEAKIQNIDLSTQGMQAGVYFISVHSAHYRKVIRVVKAY